MNCFAASLQMAGTVSTQRMSVSLISDDRSRSLCNKWSLKKRMRPANTSIAFILFPWSSISFVVRRTLYNNPKRNNIVCVNVKLSLEYCYIWLSLCPCVTFRTWATFVEKTYTTLLNDDFIFITLFEYGTELLDKCSIIGKVVKQLAQSIVSIDKQYTLNRITCT